MTVRADGAQPVQRCSAIAVQLIDELGGEDKAVRQWGFLPARQVRSFDGHSGAVTALSFSPDARWILSGGADRAVAHPDSLDGRPAQTSGLARCGPCVYRWR